VDWRKGVWVAGTLAMLIIVIVSYLAWKHYRSRDPLRNVKPGIYQPAQTNRGPTLPLPTNAPRR
jgi:hypothetical protein